MKFGKGWKEQGANRCRQWYDTVKYVSDYMTMNRWLTGDRVEKVAEVRERTWRQRRWRSKRFGEAIYSSEVEEKLLAQTGRIEDHWIDCLKIINLSILNQSQSKCQNLTASVLRSSPCQSIFILDNHHHHTSRLHPMPIISLLSQCFMISLSLGVKWGETSLKTSYPTVACAPLSMTSSSTKAIDHLSTVYFNLSAHALSFSSIPCISHHLFPPPPALVMFSTIKPKPLRPQAISRFFWQRFKPLVNSLLPTSDGLDYWICESERLSRYGHQNFDQNGWSVIYVTHLCSASHKKKTKKIGSELREWQTFKGKSRRSWMYYRIKSWSTLYELLGRLHSWYQKRMWVFASLIIQPGRNEEEGPTKL